MGVHEGPLELLSEDSLLQLRDVPAVHHGYVYAAFAGDLDTQGIEHAGFGCAMVLVDELPQSGYVHPGYPGCIRVLARIAGVHRVDGRGVDDAVGTHRACDHHRYGIGRVPRLGAAHDDDSPGRGCRGGFLSRLRDPVRHASERQSQELGVELRGPDPHDVQLAIVAAELPARRRVVSGGPPSADHDGELHAVLDREQHPCESGYVFGIIVPRDEDRTPDRYHDFVHEQPYLARALAIKTLGVRHGRHKFGRQG